MIRRSLWSVPVLLAAVLATAAPAAADAGAAAPAWDAELPPVTIVTNGWVDVREILRNVAETTALGLQIAPDVQGDVNVHLEQVPASRALEAVLQPVDLGYEVVDGVLVVHRRGLVTRWFDFDYPVTQREGRGELEISVSRDQSAGGSGGGSEGENQNKSHVTSTAIMSIWPEVMKSLQVVVFEDPMAAAGGSAENAQSLSHADAAGRSLVINPMAGLIQVTAEWDRVDRVERLLAHLQDSLQRQVAIEVRIMEVTLDRELKTGLNWDAILDSDLNSVSLNSLSTASNISDSYLQFTVDSRRVSGIMQAMASNGDLQTVSTPRVTTLNNQKAIVRVVREDVYYLASVQPAVISNGVATDPVISYTPQTVPVGVVLDVTPQVGRDGLITLNVHPTISDVIGVAESPNLDSAPILSVRELDTVGKVRDGETLIIAGLISERESRSRAGVPLLKDLPLLGALFGRTENTSYSVELVMLLTPVLMEGAEADAMADAVRAEMEERM